MELKEFREKYDNRLKEFGYEFDASGDHGNWVQVNYINKKKNTLITITLDKKSNYIPLSLLIFEGTEIKKRYDLTIDELFEFLEKHRND